MKKICENCEYYCEHIIHGDKCITYEDVCMYNPPIICNDGISRRPIIERDHWCSKFKEYKKEEQTDK